MNIHEWCIAVLKGKVNNTKCSDLYNLCTKHYRERTFDSVDELFAALEPFNEYFCFEDFKYDYVTFEDDGQRDISILELAKDVLRSHSNRYTLSVLCRKMNESGTNDVVLDEPSLKNLLSSRNCFTIEERIITLFKLSMKGKEYDIEPIILGRPYKSDEEKIKEADLKLQKKLLNEQKRIEREKEKYAKEQERILRKAIREEERERKRKLKKKKAERKENSRVDKVKTLISYYHITDETSLEQLWANKLIRKVEYTKCGDWLLYTVGQVYAWVESHNLPERMGNYRKHTVQRMLKIASFHDPALALLIPNVKFSGIQKANRGIKLSRTPIETVNESIDVKLGDVLRWNYTKDEGIVVGFDSSDGKRLFKVQQYDGNVIMFEDDPLLFKKLDGEEKDSVISKREEYIARSKDNVTTSQAISYEMEIEHVFLDSKGKIISSVVASSEVFEGDMFSGEKK